MKLARQDKNLKDLFLKAEFLETAAQKSHSPIVALSAYIKIHKGAFTTEQQATKRAALPTYNTIKKKKTIK
jgi:hypothetical protein